MHEQYTFKAYYQCCQLDDLVHYSSGVELTFNKRVALFMMKGKCQSIFPPFEWPL